MIQENSNKLLFYFKDFAQLQRNIDKYYQLSLNQAKQASMKGFKRRKIARLTKAMIKE